MSSFARPSLVVVALILAGALSPASSSPWQPPVGIPAPTFGIVETARPRPNPWLAPQAGYYYVNPSADLATDTSNPYGTPIKPRKTIPTALPAGSVVELSGTYTASHTSPRTIVSSGTAAAPVFIRGGAVRPVVTGCWEVSGSYYIIENIEFAGCGTIVMLSPSNRGVLRHSDVHGNPQGGGVGIQSWNGKNLTHMVVWNNTIHDNGDVNASYDQDVHGIAVGARVSYLWVVDNQLMRNSGDGIQINAGSAALQSTTHHIYVGRNVAYSNKQSGFWTKQAVDVIFSQNTSLRHRAGNSSTGACMGGQYAPEYVWFIDNVMTDCDFGIQMASDHDYGAGRYHFFIGNLIFGIHDSNGDFQWGSAWQNCGISLLGGTYRYVVENTIYDSDSGICASSGSTVAVYDNLVERVRSNGSHLFFGSPSLASASPTAMGNVFAPNYRLNIGGGVTVVAPVPPGPRYANHVVPSVGFLNPAGNDFRLSATSVARDNGVMHALGIWSHFQNRYGVPMGRDLYGVARSTSSPDSGGVELP